MSGKQSLLEIFRIEHFENNALNYEIPQVYRSAQKKDSTKLREIRQELEADFALKSKDDISSAIEAHKQEISLQPIADE